MGKKEAPPAEREKHRWKSRFGAGGQDMVSSVVDVLNWRYLQKILVNISSEGLIVKNGI